MARRVVHAPTEVDPKQPEQWASLPGEPRSTRFEVEHRNHLARTLLLRGLNRHQVIRQLQLPPAPLGKDGQPIKDPKTGREILGGLSLSLRRARLTAEKVIKKLDSEWEASHSTDRLELKLRLDHSMAGAMSEHKWGPVAALADKLAKITGSYQPIVVQVRSSDERRRALHDVLDRMPEDELQELLNEDDDGEEPEDGRRYDA